MMKPGLSSDRILKSWPGSILNISIPYPHKILINAVHFGANNHFPFIEISETPKSYTLVIAGVLPGSNATLGPF